MSLKILSVFDNQQVATEGLISDAIDYLTGSMYGLLSQKNAKRIVSEAMSSKNYAARKKAVEALLNQTVFNKAWCEKSIKNKTSVHENEYAFIEGRPVSDPVKLAECMTGPMFKGAKEAIDKLSDNTKLRFELIKKVNSAPDAEAADEIYEQNKSKLVADSAQAYIDRGGKSYSSVTADNMVTWPYITYKNSKSVEFCSGIYNDKEKNQLDQLTVQEAANWGRAVLQLLAVADSAHQLYRANYVPYWEDCKHEYDDLRYGDEIFEYIFSGQNGYQWDPMLGVYNTCEAFARALLYAILVK